MSRGLPEDDDFDVRVRAALMGQTAPGAPSPLLKRPRPWHARASLRLAGLALLVLAVLLPLELMRPQALVRDAIEHEYFERTLRGQFMSPEPLLSRLGLQDSQGLPGYTQLIRPCEIEGRKAYHLTSFFDKGGLVTLFAFKETVQLEEGQGRWSDVYWQVIHSRQGQPLILVAQKRKALEAALAAWRLAPDQS